jgi:5-methylcytosine-specific restriction endonuclease McrA
MKHLGQSVFKGFYRIVKHPVLSKLPRFHAGVLTPGWVVQNFGTYELRRDYHEVFQKIGGLLIDTDAILYHWAEFTSQLQKGRFAPEQFEKILHMLAMTHDQDRQVTASKQCYLEAMQAAPLYCTWCETPLLVQNLAIDHLLPFSHTQNNNLWNLLASCKNCNSAAKKARVPTRETLRQCKERILACWQLESRRYPEAFEQEIRYDLVGFDKAFVVENCLQCLSDRCEFLIQERGYDPWDRM